MIDVLIVDDDEIARSFIGKLLKKKFAVNIREAKNGLEGLDEVRKRIPDLVLLDITMPVMDGIEFLEIARSNDKYATMKVVIMSALDQRRTVSNVIKLGISDYILKPFDYEALYERLLKIMSAAKSCDDSNPFSKQSTKASENLILLIDEDINFRTFFTTLLGEKYKIIEAASGTEGIKKFMDESPSIILVANNLELLNDSMVAKKIRASEVNFPIKIYHLLDDNIKDLSPEFLFDSTLTKSFVPDVFLSNFNKIVAGKSIQTDIIKDLLDTKMISEMTTAVKQTYGVMTMQEISLIGFADFNKEHENLIEANIKLNDEDKRVNIKVFLRATEKDVLQIAGKMLDSNVGFDDGAKEAFGEILSIISGRIRSSFEMRGVKVAVGNATFSNIENDKNRFNKERTIIYKTSDGNNFLLGIDIIN